MKASEEFKSVIENFLNQTAQNDTAFATSLAKASKNIENCISYIGSEVKKTGLCAFADHEIFAIALKYYNDDSISAPVTTNFTAVVHQPSKPDLFTPSSAIIQNPVPETIAKQTSKPSQTTLTLFDL